MEYVTKEQWNMIFTHSSEGIIFIDNNGMIESMNPEAERLTGYTPSEAGGKGINDIFKVEGQDELIQQQVSDTKPSGDIVEPSYIEALLTQKNGEKIWVSCSFTRIPDGDSDKMVIFARDINESKKVEQMRSDFISIASHELRTPLTVISGYLSLILSGKLGKLTETQSDFIKQIFEDTLSLSSLVEDLLDVSRLDSGKFRLHKSAVYIGELIKRTIDSLTDKALERNITVIYSSDKSVPPVYADKAKLRQVLTNLIDNAIKYTNPGGKIKVNLKISETEFIITVEDNGYGIEKKDLPHIFDRFYRAENKLHDRVAGAGLGLYISKTIISLHDGTIGVESAIQKGTVFTVVLPRDTAFEQGQSVQKEEKQLNAFQQFISNFLHGKRRKELNYE